MTGFMGYDTDRVMSLRSAMQRAEFELNGIRANDAEATVAMQYVRRAQRTIGDTWLPMIDSLLACQALTAYQPARLDANDLTMSRLGVRQQLYGWSVVTDPLIRTDGTITVDQAQALGWRLSNGQIGALVSDDELAWLDKTLALIARRPALIDAFLVNMTAAGWTRLCNQLGDDRIALMATRTVEGHLAQGLQRRLTAIDSIFADLATVLVDDRARHPSRDPRSIVATMHPYAAAMVVQHLRLTAAELAEVSEKLIGRYRSGGWGDVQRAGPGTADILMQAMIQTSGAPAAFVSRVAHDPTMLLDSAHDSALAQKLILLGTDPANMTVHESGVVIPGLIHYISDSYVRGGFYGQTDPAVGLFAVDLIAPWLLQFTPGHVAAWGLSGGAGTHLLQSVMDDQGAFARLSTRREAIAAGLTKRIGTSSNAARHALEDLAAILALIDTLTRRRTMSNAADARQLWDIGFAVIGATTSVLAGGPIANVSSGAAFAGLHALLIKGGIAPMSAHDVEHDTLYVLDWQTTVAAATMVCAAFDQMVRDGRIARATPPPPLPDPETTNPGVLYSVTFSTWLDANALGQEGLLLNAIKQTIASDHEAERNATELAMG